MNRTKNCGELTKSNLGQTVKLSGWVNKIREKGFIIWVDLRDRYGITQLVFDKERSNDEIFTTADRKSTRLNSSHSSVSRMPSSA